MRSGQARVLEAIAVWDDVCVRLRPILSELDMLEILGSARGLSVEAHVLWVSVPTEWHRFQLQNNALGRAIAYAVSQELGEGGRLEVRVESEL